MPLNNRTEAFLAFIDTQLRAAQWAIDDGDTDAAKRAVERARQSISEWHAGERTNRQANAS
jgi:hypothetical protein